MISTSCSLGTSLIRHRFRFESPPMKSEQCSRSNSSQTLPNPPRDYLEPELIETMRFSSAKWARPLPRQAEANDSASERRGQSTFAARENAWVGTIRVGSSCLTNAPNLQIPIQTPLGLTFPDTSLFLKVVKRLERKIDEKLRFASMPVAASHIDSIG